MSKRSLAIDFNGVAGCSVAMRMVTGTQCIMQRALTTVGTVNGTDVADPERGTTLIHDFLFGLVYDQNTAVHYANIAAVDATFTVAGQTFEEDLGLLEFALSPVATTSGWKLLGTARFTDGTTTSSEF